jgi:hypothetical protein
MLNKLILSCLVALSLNAAQEQLIEPVDQTFKIKFWKVPNVKHVDFLDNTKDKKVFEKWSYEKKSPIRFFSSVDDPRAIDYITLSMQTECFLDKTNYSCLTRDLDGRDFSMRHYPLELGKPYIVEPKLYAFDNKFGVIFVDFSDKTYGSVPDLELKNRIDGIPSLMEYLSESAKIPLNNIVVLGNFGVNADYLKKTFSEKLNVLMSNPDTIVIKEGQKVFLTNSQNILVAKDSTLVQKVAVRNDIVKFKNFNSIKRELTYLENNVSSFLPIEVEVKVPLNHYIR